MYARPASGARRRQITKKCSDHEIFITKIYVYGISSNFMKILNHENLELYGIPSRLNGVVLTSSSSHDGSQSVGTLPDADSDEVFTG